MKNNNPLARMGCDYIQFIGDNIMKQLSKNYKNVGEMAADGWTQEEMVALNAAPRSRAASCNDPSGPFTWPLVNGHKIIYSLFTRAEKDLYNTWYKSHHQGSSSGGKSLSDEDKKKWKELLELVEKTGDEVLKQKVLELMPKAKAKNAAMQRLFAVDTVAELKSKVTLEWILYRGKDDVRGTNPEQFDLQAAIAEFGMDFHPVMTKADVQKIITELKNKGIDVASCIIGL